MKQITKVIMHPKSQGPVHLNPVEYLIDEENMAIAGCIAKQKLMQDVKLYRRYDLIVMIPTELLCSNSASVA